MDKTGDHPPPKRATTAWQLFNFDYQAQMRAVGRGKDAYALSKKAWAAATEEEKQPWVKRALEDKQRC